MQVQSIGLLASPDVNSRLRIGRSYADGPGYFKVQPAGERLGTATNGSHQTTSKTEPSVVRLVFAVIAGRSARGNEFSLIDFSLLVSDDCVLQATLKFMHTAFTKHRLALLKCKLICRAKAADCYFCKCPWGSKLGGSAV